MRRSQELFYTVEGIPVNLILEESVQGYPMLGWSFTPSTELKLRAGMYTDNPHQLQGLMEGKDLMDLRSRQYVRYQSTARSSISDLLFDEETAKEVYQFMAESTKDYRRVFNQDAILLAVNASSGKMVTLDLRNIQSREGEDVIAFMGSFKPSNGSVVDWWVYRSLSSLMADPFRPRVIRDNIRVDTASSMGMVNVGLFNYMNKKLRFYDKTKPKDRRWLNAYSGRGI